jgi:hypothetical protein
MTDSIFNRRGCIVGIGMLLMSGLFAIGAQAQWQPATGHATSTTGSARLEPDPVSARLSALEAKVKTQAGDIERLQSQIGILQAFNVPPKGYTRAFATKANFNREADNVAVFYFTPH